MTTKKFWCHYIGSDDKPKRRSIELTSLADLLPRMNGKHVTPLWCERDEEESYSRKYVYYYLYAQLSDNVAVAVQHRISDTDLEMLLQSDEDIRLRSEKVWAGDLERCTTEEGRKRLLENREDWRNAETERRERYYEQLNTAADFDTYLLTKARWINRSILRAYEEAQSPYLPVLQALRERFEQEREEERLRRVEENKKRLEEEERKKAEAYRQEQERLTQEAGKFKEGKSISGEDVVELCRRYNIAIHLRTVHNLQQVIATINGKNGTCQYYRQRGKRSPQLDGCYLAAAKLYKYLQEH